MCCWALCVLGTNLDRWSAVGFCTSHPRPISGCSLLPPCPCCYQGFLSPLLGHFGLIPEQSQAQCRPISWTFFLVLPLAVGSIARRSALPGSSQFLALGAGGGGEGAGQSRWCRAPAVGSHRFGFESPSPHRFTCLSLPYPSVTQGSGCLCHEVVKIIEENDHNITVMRDITFPRDDMYQVLGSFRPLQTRQGVRNAAYGT